MDSEDFDHVSDNENDEEEENMEDFMEYDDDLLDYEEEGLDVDLDAEIQKLEQENLEEFEEENNKEKFRGPKEIIVDKKYLERLMANMQTSQGFETSKKLIRLFGECVKGDEPDLEKNKRIYIINDVEMVDTLITYMLMEFPKFLEEKSGLE